MDPFLNPNRYVDSDHPAVIAFANEHAAGLPPREAVVALCLAVRDGWRYNPYRLRFGREDFRASGVLLREATDGAHCIDKALLLAATARAVGVPSRLHFADVRNHIGTARLEEHLGTDLMVFHGYTGLHIDGHWVAATPAFDARLCARLGVDPLHFDGREDSIFQTFDRHRGRFMEYVTDHGAHAGIPYEQMIAAWRTHYGHLLEDVPGLDA